MASSKYSFDATRENALLPSRLSELLSSAADVKGLADYLGVSTQAINQYKLGVSYPKTENLIKIAEYFGISVDYLLNLTGVPNRDTSIQAVNSVTGLSVRAIIKLHDLHTNDPSMVDVISSLIEDDNAVFFLVLLKTLFSFANSEEGNELITTDICGKPMNLYEENLLQAVLQAKLIENIPEVARQYKALSESRRSKYGERS